ncbi:hypothetical protein RHGRI_011219 [Rhododendron griersonianum]|uniref:Uncharacterized protein n=1 Tax=Rhododendron griersonianum TaxID=479676 RepID=A0AAV6KL37_9ERIC|nr:hypothetical protein RHGRI_011219 [Rhododendron griersonianum]
MLLHLVMDKSWMKLGSTAHGRTSQPYFDGVNSFLEYAAAVGDRQGDIRCHRDDVDAEIISGVVPSDGILEDNVEAEADEEQEIFEDDMDVDMDYDL